MIIFDFNYEHLFRSTKNFKNLVDLADNQTPIIFGYIPKLFREDCYKTYNIISSEEKKIQYEKCKIETYKKLEFETLKKKSESNEEEIFKLKQENARLKAENIKNKEEINKLKAEDIKKKKK